MQPDKASGWKTQSGFIWAVLGSVVGFANVLSFSSQCYQNGGGAFLIPYLLAYIILGTPMLLLEGLIGQRLGLPLVSAYGVTVGKAGKLLGWIAVLSCLTIGAFYIVLTSYSLIYTFFEISSTIPSDTATFFQQNFLKSTSNIKDFGVFGWNIFLVVLIIAFFVWWTLIRDISKGVEKVCSLVMPLLSVLILFFAIASSCLPGAMAGIAQFVRPDFSRLFELSLWRDVFGQLFFSLSLGLGIITGYAQYNGKKIQLKKAMTFVAIGDFMISFVAGWVVFACVGYMSHHQGIPIGEVIKTDSAFEIGFIIFPKILQTFSPYLQPFLGCVFFFCIFVAGITGVFSIVESIAGNFQREFSQPRKKAVTWALSIIAFLSFFFCMGNGQVLIGALAPMVLGINMIISAFFEIICFLYLSPEISKDVLWYKKNSKYQLYFYILKFIVPVVLLGILLGAIARDFENIGSGFYIRWLWLACALGFSYLFIKKSSFNQTPSKGLVSELNV